MTDTRMHWCVYEDNVATAMCGVKKGRIGCANRHQMRRVLASSADTCAECIAYYELHKRSFDEEERRANYIDKLMEATGERTGLSNRGTTPHH